MTRDQLRTNVWEEMIFAYMRAQYFSELCRKNTGMERNVRIGALLASSGAAATALSAADPVIKLGLPILAAAASLALLICQFGTLAREASDLHIGWERVGTQYERLWNDIDAPNAEVKFHQIYDGADPLSKAASRFPYNTKRLEHWEDEAAKLLLGRYSPQSA